MRRRLSAHAGSERVRRDQSQVPREHQKREQHDREPDAHRERSSQFRGITLLTARQVKKRGAEAGDDADERDYDENTCEGIHTIEFIA